MRVYWADLDFKTALEGGRILNEWHEAQNKCDSDPENLIFRSELIVCKHRYIIWAGEQIKKQEEI